MNMQTQLQLPGGEQCAIQMPVEAMCVFLVLLACLAPVLALPFYGAHYQELHGLPRIREGVLDLSAVPLEDVDWIPLNGKWHYYPSQWLQTDSPGGEPVHQWTMLPTMWNTSGQGESFSPRYGYGSYSLTINGFPQDGDWLVYLPGVDAAYRVYLNGTLVRSSGIPSKDGSEVLVDDEVIKNVLALPQEPTMEIVVEASTKYTPVLNSTPVLIRSGTDLAATNIRYTLTSFFAGGYLLFFVLCGFLLCSGDKLLASPALFLLCAVVQMILVREGEMGATARLFLPFLASRGYYALTTVLSNFVPILMLFSTQHLLQSTVTRRQQLGWVLLIGVSLLGQYLPLPALKNYVILFRALGFVPALTAVALTYGALRRGQSYALSLAAAWIVLLSGFVISWCDFLGMYIFNVSIYLPTCYAVTLTILITIYVRRSLASQRAQRELQAKELEYSRLETKVRENENLLMLSQIHPHFIYNALLAIHSLNKEHPQAANEALMQFAKYLRFNMSVLTKREPIPFSQELSHIRNYVAIEQLRFGERLEMAYEIECEDFSLPALCVQPLVENAIKHSICRRIRGGRVALSTRRVGHTVQITVWDDGVGFDTAILEAEGRVSLGIANIKQRLTLFGHAALQIESMPWTPSAWMRSLIC